MSHAVGQSEHVEPNLTPMLDLVLQILMFFIATTSLSAEQVNVDITLPPAQFAKPLAANNQEYLYLNINYNQETNTHEVRTLGKEPMTKKPEIDIWLQRQYEDLARYAKDGKVDVTVVIRADRNANYSEVYNLMKSCQEVGFRKLAVRALIGG